MPKPEAPSLPQGRWRRQAEAGRRTKPRPHKRKRMRGGISRNLPWRCRKALYEPEGPPTRRRLRESPRGTSRQGNGARLNAPGRDPQGIADKASALAAAPGERQGFRAAPRSEGRPERLRPRCEPWNRSGFGRAGSAREAAARLSATLKRPDRDRREAFGPLPRPKGTEQGASPAPGPWESGGGFTSRRDPEAAQREMAAPPSDGSQGWDKWGPVATPAPIILAPWLPSLRGGRS